MKNYAAPRSYGVSIRYVFMDFGMTDGVRADVEEEPPDELARLEGHDLLFPDVPVSPFPFAKSK